MSQLDVARKRPYRQLILVLAAAALLITSCVRSDRVEPVAGALADLQEVIRSGVVEDRSETQVWLPGKRSEPRDIAAAALLTSQMTAAGHEGLSVSWRTILHDLQAALTSDEKSYDGQTVALVLRVYGEADVAVPEGVRAITGKLLLPPANDDALQVGDSLGLVRLLSTAGRLGIAEHQVVSSLCQDLESIRSENMQPHDRALAAAAMRLASDEGYCDFAGYVAEECTGLAKFASQAIGGSDIPQRILTNSYVIAACRDRISREALSDIVKKSWSFLSSSQQPLSPGIQLELFDVSSGPDIQWTERSKFIVEDVLRWGGMRDLWIGANAYSYVIRTALLIDPSYAPKILPHEGVELSKADRLVLSSASRRNMLAASELEELSASLAADAGYSRDLAHFLEVALFDSSTCGLLQPVTERVSSELRMVPVNEVLQSPERAAAAFMVWTGMDRCGFVDEADEGIMALLAEEWERYWSGHLQGSSAATASQVLATSCWLPRSSYEKLTERLPSLQVLHASDLDTFASAHGLEPANALAFARLNAPDRVCREGQPAAKG